jgi:hypothetical protein
MTMAIDKYSKLRSEGKLNGTLKACRAKAAERAARKAIKKQPRLCVIPLGDLTEAQTKVEAQRLNARIQNWEGRTIEQNSLKSKSVNIVATNHGRYSSRCTYNRYTYRPAIRSCGAVTARRLLWFCGGEFGKIAAPRGWRFGRDINGLFIARVNGTDAMNRYHFLMDDVKGGAAGLRSAALAHEEKQRKAAADKKAKQKAGKLLDVARSLGVWVRVSDSLRSGNCAAGTMSFARSHNLGTVAVPAVILQRISGSVVGYQREQIARAISYAEQRSAEDLARGFCRIN